jgi:transposase
MCKLVFLPPYSPDYNPIEQAFSSIKSYLHRHFLDKSLTAIVRACQILHLIKQKGISVLLVILPRYSDVFLLEWIFVITV